MNKVKLAFINKFFILTYIEHKIAGEITKILVALAQRFNNQKGKSSLTPKIHLQLERDRNRRVRSERYDGDVIGRESGWKCDGRENEC